MTDVETVRSKFLRYGLPYHTLSIRHITSLIARGKSLEDIYGIGCDAYCGVNNTPKRRK